MTTFCVSGSRGITDEEWVDTVLCETIQWGDTILVGDAKGVDTIVHEWLNTGGVFVEVYKADWDKHGRAAGPIRNDEMVRKADVVIAFWDGQSNGTRDAISRAIRYGKELHVYVYPEQDE